MTAEMMSACAAVLSGIAALGAIVVSIVVYRGQSALSIRIHESQAQLSQRQLLLPLWQYISSLNRINPEAPVTPDVLNIVNTLELVALSVEGQMVDAKVIKRTFNSLYLELYDQVAACQRLPGLNKSGRDLLRENPAAMAFYSQLTSEYVNQNRIP